MKRNIEFEVKSMWSNLSNVEQFITHFPLKWVLLLLSAKIPHNEIQCELWLCCGMSTHIHCIHHTWQTIKHNTHTHIYQCRCLDASMPLDGQVSCKNFLFSRVLWLIDCLCVRRIMWYTWELTHFFGEWSARTRIHTHTHSHAPVHIACTLQLVRMTNSILWCGSTQNEWRRKKARQNNTISTKRSSTRTESNEWWTKKKLISGTDKM